MCVLRARRAVVGQQRVHLRRGVVGQQRGRDGAGRLGVLRRPHSVVDQQRVHLRRGVVGQQRSREGRVRRRDGVGVGRDAQRVGAVGQRSRERSFEMQVANDVASANELPSCEARPGRRVSNSAAGKLQGGEVREDCVEALDGLAGGERGVRGVRGQQPRVGLGALERRDAGVTASKLRCDEGLGGETQQGICYLGVYLQRSVQPVHRGEQGGQRAGVRLADEGGVQGCRGDCVQEGCRYLRAHLRGSVDGRLQGVRRSGRWRENLLGGTRAHKLPRKLLRGARANNLEKACLENLLR